MDYDNKKITDVGYFDLSNGTLKDLKRLDCLEVIRWIPYFIADGHSPTTIRDLIEVLDQAFDCLGRKSDIQYVVKFEDGPIKKLKDYNLLTD